ncbi:MAG TPA: NlpC/P60 family protein [Acidimicrobiales bacterium]
MLDRPLNRRDLLKFAAGAAALVAVPAVMVAPASAAAAPAMEGPPALPQAGRAGIAVRTALAQVGKPYRRNSAGPGAFDCSGLMQYAWARAGVAVPHSSSAIGRMRRVPLSQVQPGDIVGRRGHVGMYIGGGRMVHAPQTGTRVHVAGIGRMRWAVRPG